MKLDWKPAKQRPQNLDRCLVWVSDIDWKPQQPHGVCMGQIAEGIVMADGKNGGWTITHWAEMPDGPETSKQ